MAIESACIQAAQSGESNEIFRELEINYLAAPKVYLGIIPPFPFIASLSFKISSLLLLFAGRSVHPRGGAAAQ